MTRKMRTQRATEHFQDGLSKYKAASSTDDFLQAAEAFAAAIEWTPDNPRLFFARYVCGWVWLARGRLAYHPTARTPDAEPTAIAILESTGRRFAGTLRPSAWSLEIRCSMLIAEFVCAR